MQVPIEEVIVTHPFISAALAFATPHDELQETVGVQRLTQQSQRAHGLHSPLPTLTSAGTPCAPPSCHVASLCVLLLLLQVGVCIVIKEHAPRPSLTSLREHCAGSLHQSKWPDLVCYLDRMQASGTKGPKETHTTNSHSVPMADTSP